MEINSRRQASRWLHDNKCSWILPRARSLKRHGVPAAEAGEGSSFVSVG